MKYVLKDHFPLIFFNFFCVQVIRRKKRRATNLRDFLGDVVLNVRNDRQLVAVFHRRQVPVRVAILQRPLQVWSHVAGERRPSVADRHVARLGQMKSNVSGIHRRTVRHHADRVVAQSVAVPAAVVQKMIFLRN